MIWKTYYPAHNKAHSDTATEDNVVSLFLGCTSNLLASDTLKASIYVLNKLGVDVHIPERQTCCASIAKQMGFVGAI